MSSPYLQTVEDLQKALQAYLPMNLDPLLQLAEQYLELHHHSTFPLHFQNCLLALLDLRADMTTFRLLFLLKLPKELRKKFLDQVITNELLLSLEQLSSLSTIESFRNEQSVDTVRKMFLAMSKDFRGVLVLMVIRYADLFELIHYSPNLRRQIARQTLEVFVPIAGRLGIYTLKRKLEDMSFSHLSFEEFQSLETSYQHRSELSDRMVSQLSDRLEKYLQEKGIDAQVSGRIKGKYSTFTKLKRKGNNHLESIYDLLALRVVVPDDVDCYTVVSLLHQKWHAVRGRFKDYIAMPKVNGYRSLHTVVEGMIENSKLPVEIQVRTDEMHREAEYGIAAHWWYEEEGSLTTHREKSQSYQEKVQWVKNLLRLQQQMKTETTLSHVDMFSDRIFVMTLNGMVLELPKGSTPLDFAYSLSEQLGHHCFKAKVNGKVVPLDYELCNGDRVFVVKKMSVQPNLYWLSLVHTEKARNAIRSFLLEKGEESVLDQGIRLLNEALRRYDEPALDHEYQFLSHYEGSALQLNERKELLIEIAEGDIDPEAVVRTVLSQRQLDQQSGRRKPRKIQTNQVYIAGESGFRTKIAACCSPQDGDAIVGYVTRGGVITLHQRACKMLAALDTQRFVEASWTPDAAKPQVGKLQVVLENSHLLQDLSNVLQQHRVSVRKFEHQDQQDGRVKLTFRLQAPHDQALPQVVQQWRQIDGVAEVHS